MITLEIQSENALINRRLIKTIRRLVPYNVVFSFFYEPKLIIRISRIELIHILPYLKNKKIKYKVYAYPFGKGYGESKKGVVIRYFDYFTSLFQLNSQISLARNKKYDIQIIERYNHTFINSLGYEWEDETLFYIKLAYIRINCIRKYADRSFIIRIFCHLLLIHLSIFYRFVKLLK